MSDHPQGSAKYTVAPADLNAATASIFEGHIRADIHRDHRRPCLRHGGHRSRTAAGRGRRPWWCVLLDRGKRHQLGRLALRPNVFGCVDPVNVPADDGLDVLCSGEETAMQDG